MYSYIKYVWISYASSNNAWSDYTELYKKLIKNHGADITLIIDMALIEEYNLLDYTKSHFL